jgi:hypothetical protein
MTATSSSSSKRKTLIDIYYLYKYKKNIKAREGTTPKPFVKQADCTDHKLSADYTEWRDVVAAYLEKLKLFMEEGNTIELASKVGTFSLRKVKAKNGFTDFKKSKEQGKQIKFKNNNADNYYILYNWDRNKTGFKLKWYWWIQLNRGWICSIYQKCETDFTAIYKIKDTK